MTAVRLPAGVQPGDVLAVHTGDSWGNRAIRFGQWFNAARRWKPGSTFTAYSWANHVIMVSHWNEDRTVLWGIEGRPGGIGYVDLTSRTWQYLAWDGWVQKTAQQRAACVTFAREVMVNRPYDWDAITYEALQALGIPWMWEQKTKDGAPVDAICSTAWLHIRRKVGLPVPEVPNGRPATPLDWDRFCARNAA